MSSQHQRGAGIGIAVGVAFIIAIDAPIVGADPACGDWTLFDPPAGATLTVSEVAVVSENDALLTVVKR